MSIHTNIQLKLYDYLNGDISSVEQNEIKEHIATCSICSTECEELSAIIESSRALKKNPSRELPEEYWQGFAAVVERRIATNQISQTPVHLKWWEPLLSYVRYRPQVAVAFGSFVVIVALALSLLLVVNREAEIETTERLSDVITQPINIDDRVGRYLKKSKVLLVGLSNMEAGEGLTNDLSTERTVSRQLANEAHYLQLQPIDFQAARLIRDLARVQEELAQAKEEDKEKALRLIRESIYDNNLLFKVRMAESVYGDARFVSARGGNGVK